MPFQHAYTQTIADGTATSVVRPSDWNSAHQEIQYISGNTVGVSSATGTNIVYQGGNNVTLSVNQGANAATIVVSGANTVAQSVQTQAAGNIAGVGSTFGGTNISGSMTVNSNGVALSLSAAAPGGGAGVTLSAYEPNANGPLTYTSMGQNSLFFVPIKPLNNVQGTVVNVLVSANTASSSVSHAVSRTLSYGLYSLGSGASSTQMGQVATSSMAIIGSFSSNLSGGYTFSQGANSSTYSSAGTLLASSLSGQKIFGLPFNMTLNEGSEYYFGMAQSTASVGNTGAHVMSHGFVQLNSSTAASTWGRMGPTGATVSSGTFFPNYAGFVYSTTSGAWPATIGLSQRSIIPGNARLYLNIDS